jgi:nicotinamidase-related amidase
MKKLALAASLALLGACASQPPTPAAMVVPDIPAPVPVSIDSRTSALLVLDINSAICPPRPQCMASVPAIERLIARARAANVPVVYSTTVSPKGPPPLLPSVAPQPNDPVVATRANKFVDTKLEEILKQRNAQTLVMVGSASNGAVLYTSFHANSRGFTVVVAEDGISGTHPFDNTLTRYQLLNQPGFTNAGNKALAPNMVTLSRTDLITFR